MKNLISTEIMLFFNVSQHYYKSQCFTFMLLTFKQLCYNKAICVSIFKLPSTSHHLIEQLRESDKKGAVLQLTAVRR